MKKAGKKKVLSLVLAGCIILSTVGGALAPLFVYALPPALIKARTIGEIIVTLFAASGTAITNTTVVPAIYSAYDSSYYSLESMVNNGVLIPVDGSTADQAIAAIGTGTKNYQPFSLDAENFREYIYGNWNDMESYGVDAILRLNEIANTDSVYGAIDNLGQLCLDVANYGYLGTVNSIAIVANPGQAVQVGITNVLDAIKGVYGGNIESGIDINIAVSPEYKTVVGENYYSYGSIERSYMLIDGDYTGIYWGNIQTGGFSCVCKRDGVVRYATGSTLASATRSMNNNPETNQDTVFYLSNRTGNNINNSIVHGAIYCGEFSSVQDFKNYIIANDIPYYVQSPDIINQDQGNITDIDSTVPAISGNEKIDIIDSDDYNNFLQDSQTDPGMPNAEIMQDLLIPYISEIDNKESWQDPNVPPTNPIDPAQPTIGPKPEVDPEVVDDVMVPVVPDITGVFPFCIPWDILAFVRGLNMERTAPVITWNFKVDRIGLDYVFEIDFSDYEDAAEILRLMELILFIISLAVATRRLIGA